MHPVLVDISESIKIYSFGTFIVLAFLVASWFARRRASKLLGVDKERVFSVCFTLLFIGLLGARMAYVFLKYEEFAARPMSFLEIWNGGLVWYGGLIACLLWLSWYLPRRPELKGFALLDILALAACLAIFVGRQASFLSGENYGKIAPGLPWAVTFPPVAYTQVPGSHIGQPLHPTQLYHALHGLVLFGLLLVVAKRKPGPGALTGLFLVLYAVGRAVIEIWRDDDVARGMAFGGRVSTSQLISIPIFFLGLALLLSRWRKRASRQEA
ncbi:MAG: prolipoprotein diacylglyceryl transferase [Planctomycetota bacterium]